MKIDAHQDLLYHVYPFSTTDKNVKEYAKARGQISLEKLKKSGVNIVFSSIFTEPEFYNKGKERLLEQINYHEDFLNNNSRDFYLFKNIKDSNKKKLALLLHIEGYYAQVGDLTELYENGVRSISLTWNNRNQYAGGSKSNGGITFKGRRLVEEIGKRKIILDLAHLNSTSFWDVLRIYKNKPPIVSHTACYSLCQDSRNLKDDQIKEIASRKGVVGIFFSGKFLKKSGRYRIEDLIDHISHIIDLVGIDFVGIGSDLGGIVSGTIVKGLEDVSKISNLVSVFKRAGYTKEDIEKIMGGNFKRVLREVLK